MSWMPGPPRPAILPERGGWAGNAPSRAGSSKDPGRPAQATYLSVGSVTEAPFTMSDPLDGSVDWCQPEIAAIE